MGFCDIGQAVASVAVPEDSNPVDLEWTLADMPALQPGPPHAGAHPFDDKVALQLGDRPSACFKQAVDSETSGIR